MDMTTRRLAEIAGSQSPGEFGAKHLQAIHRFIFQDVYGWAGEFRSVNISRPGQFPFAFSDQVQNSLNKLAGDLAKERRLAGLSQARFVKRAARYMGELNAVHPFRDGNGRAQREFIRVLAARNGHALDWSRISPGQMIEASKRSFQQGETPASKEFCRRLSKASGATHWSRRMEESKRRGIRASIPGWSLIHVVNH